MLKRAAASFQSRCPRYQRPSDPRYRLYRSGRVTRIGTPTAPLAVSPSRRSATRATQARGLAEARTRRAQSPGDAGVTPPTRARPPLLGGVGRRQHPRRVARPRSATACSRRSQRPSLDRRQHEPAGARVAGDRASRSSRGSRCDVSRASRMSPDPLETATQVDRKNRELRRRAAPTARRRPPDRRRRAAGEH